MDNVTIFYIIVGCIVVLGIHYGLLASINSKLYYMNNRINNLCIDVEYIHKEIQAQVPIKHNMHHELGEIRDTIEEIINRMDKNKLATLDDKELLKIARAAINNHAE